jgi:hypothetical protein
VTLLDHLLPVWDAQRIERRVIPVPMSVAYDAALQTDFLDAVRHSRIVRALFAMRSAFERAIAFVRRRAFSEPPTPAALRLADLPAEGEWVRLDAERPSEFAFGVTGRFWDGETRWLKTDRTSFRMLETPGLARLGCHLMFRQVTPESTEVEYLARTRTTDEKSRESFLNYWMVVSPFVGFIMRTTLRAIEQNAMKQRTPHPAFTLS